MTPGARVVSRGRAPAHGAPGRMTMRHAVDLLAGVGLLLPGVLAFGPVFGSGDGYRAAAVGVIGGLAVAVLAWWRRWGVVTSAGAVAAAYVLLGTVAALPRAGIAGVVPTGDTLRRLGVLVIEAWRDLLTVSVPASDFDGPAVVPFLAGLLAAVLTGSLALRARRYLFALVPAAGLLLVGILWGTKAHPLSSLQGGLFAGVALSWGAYRQWLQRLAGGRHVLDGRVSGLPRWRRAIAATAVLLLALGAGVAVAVGLGERTNRHILRDDIIPPLDGRAFTSPLSRFRALETRQRDTVLFTVTGLSPGQRIRLAALDTYDGQVYSLSDRSATFLRVGSRLDTADQAGIPQRLHVEVRDFRGPWLPGGGRLRAVRFAGADTTGHRLDVYYNAATSTLLTTGPLPPGTRYDLDIVPVGVVPTKQLGKDLAASATAEVAIPPPVGVPEVVETKATALTGDKPTAYDQLVALQRSLAEGYFTQEKASGHGYKRIGQFLGEDTLAGDDEQYAVAMALMALSLGLPARVVVGFYPDEPVAAGQTLAVTGEMGHVWVEVAFQPERWVVFDPTPPRDRTPDESRQGTKDGRQPQLPAPPIPPRADLDQPDDSDTGAPRRTTPDQNDPPAEVVRWSAIAAGGVGVVALPVLVVLGLKGRRRRRRRSCPLLADRASGGWDEVTDRARDHGVQLPPAGTRRETARVLGAAFPGASALGLAERVDARVFGDPPAEDDVRQLWAEVDRVLRQMGSARGRFARWRARLSLRSLRGR